MAEAFLATDAILNILLNVCDGIVVYPKVIRSRIMAELPFMASENIMMSAVKKGGDPAGAAREDPACTRSRPRKVVKEEGGKNDLIERICADASFGLDAGRGVRPSSSPRTSPAAAPQQVEEFLRDVIRPVLAENSAVLGDKRPS